MPCTRQAAGASRSTRQVKWNHRPRRRRSLAESGIAPSLSLGQPGQGPLESSEGRSHLALLHALVVFPSPAGWSPLYQFYRTHVSLSYSVPERGGCSLPANRYAGGIASPLGFSGSPVGRMPLRSCKLVPLGPHVPKHALGGGPPPGVESAPVHTGSYILTRSFPMEPERAPQSPHPQRIPPLQDDPPPRKYVAPRVNLLLARQTWISFEVFRTHFLFLVVDRPKTTCS